MSIAHVSRALYLPDMPNGEKVLLLALADAANQDGYAFPGRTRLSVACNCTERHVGSMLAKLAERGLIAIRARGRKGNAYLVFPTAAAVADYGFQGGSGVPTEDAKGGSLDAEKEEVQDAPRARTQVGEPSGEPSGDMSQKRSGKVGIGTIVHSVKVTEDEFARGEAIVAVFNRRSGRSLSLATREHLRLVIGRLRDEPEWTLEDFDRLIEAVLGDPWWDGAATLNVVFSPKVWETNKARLEGGTAASKAAQGQQNADDFREAARRMRDAGLG